MKLSISHHSLVALPALAMLSAGPAQANHTTNPATPAGGTAVPAALVFGDVDGDGLDDAFVVGLPGQSRLLMNFGNGRFEDVTEASGLAELGGASCALFADFDGDGKADLFTGSSTTRLWRNLGNATFAPVQSGIEHDLVDLAASAFDQDKDGLLDLQLHTEAGDMLYRNAGNGRFERIDLPLGNLPQAPSRVGWIAPESADASDPLAALDASTPAQRRLGRWAQGRAVGGFRSTNAGAFSGASASGPSLPFLASCQPGIRDANGGACIGASSTPTLGMLFPMSTDLNVSGSGFVGIGTASPAARLDVAGSVRIADGTQGVDRVLKSSAAGDASWGPKIVTGSYTPTWTNVQGFSGIPGTRNARYARVGDVVTVVASFDFATFATGDNKAAITLPPGLPVAAGSLAFLVSGTFSNGTYLDAGETKVGIIGLNGSSSTSVYARLRGATASGAATCWCNFSYVTDAP